MGLTLRCAQGQLRCSHSLSPSPATIFPCKSLHLVAVAIASDSSEFPGFADKTTLELSRCVAIAVCAPAAFAREVIEDQRIAFVINLIAEMHDATFIRNGSECDAKHAADHMRLKLRFADTCLKQCPGFGLRSLAASSAIGLAQRLA